MDIQICEDRHISTHLQRFGATTDEIPLRSWRCLRYLDALPGGSLQGIYSDAAQHGRTERTEICAVASLLCTSRFVREQHRQTDGHPVLLLL